MTNTNPTPTPERPDPASMTYEQAKDELRRIVGALESGSLPLEDTLELWQRGELLATRCKLILDEASARIEAAELAGGTQPEGGTTSSNPMV